MNDIKADMGLVGLGVMGRNLAYNVADHNFTLVGMDLDKDKVKALTDGDTTGRVSGVNSMDELIGRLKKPRAILLLVPAGKPVDAVIGELKDKLDKGDIIIDGGNSHFTDTERHAGELSGGNISFFGMGISGGSEGARRGPSMMPGGPKEAYDRVKPIFEAVAAKVDDDPCVTYLGPGTAGHYVKMVHNGIEYALMQLISETYDILRRIGKLSNDELADLYADWNGGELSSFLIEITARIFKIDDNETYQRLIDMVLDAAKQKGTGKWTSQDAMNLQVPVPNIDVAVAMRNMSAFKDEREKAATIFPPSDIPAFEDRGKLIDNLGKAFRFGMIAAYAQGMALLKIASDEYKYGLNLADVARIWRGGCIIRARLLEDIRKVFHEHPDLPNLMIEKPFSDILTENRNPLREIVDLACRSGVPVPGMANALAYFDAYRTFQLPANLIQAQRDCFGSHTYERIDREGTFHSEW